MRENKPPLLVLSLFLALVLAGARLQAQEQQEVKSVRASLKINTLPPEVSDEQPPAISYINPRIPLDMPFTSPLPEMDFIARVSDDSELSFVSLNAEMLSVSQEGIFSTRLKLQPGENRFRILAMDQHENLLEQELLVHYVPPKISLAEKIESESTYYGLIVGINQYKDRDIPDLDHPIRDAQTLTVLLKEHYGFRDESIHFLKNATRGDLIRALDELSRQVGPGDNLLIFYAGHGWWDPDSDNGYWLPSDAERHVKTNWFRNSTLVDYLKEINSRHTLLITDACFGGSIFKTRSAFGSEEKAFEKLYELPSRKAMTSGNLSEVPDRSSFTHYLMRRLSENSETYMSSEQLFSSFRMAVINNSDAIPMYGEIEKTGDEGGDFIFLKKDP